MKKCLICNNQLKDDYDDVCPSCKAFHDWKYAKRKRNGRKSLVLFKNGGNNNGKKKTH
ncbi:MAG: hypothetical protein Q8O89_08405 [Nanoarchaeota archaeon]|nr:hypothetical protein [Nanoarchaeota archaeon]